MVTASFVVTPHHRGTRVRRIAVAVIMAVLGGVVTQPTAAAESAAESAAAASGSTYTALPTPARIMDTRTATGGHHAPVGPQETVTLAVPGLPADATAAVITIAGTGATSDTYLSVFPGQSTGTSTLNLVAGQTAAITTFATVSAADTIKVYNASGSVHVVVDLVGYFAASSGSGFDVGVPARILDTRTATGGHQAPLGANEVATLPVRGAGGVPADATAVVVNVTAVSPTTGTYLALTPDGQAGTSTVNVERGGIRANLAVVGIGGDGAIRVRNAFGSTHVLVDVQGWFGPAEHGRYVPTAAPMRLLDTRTQGGALGAGETRYAYLGDAGQPASIRTATVFGLTAVRPTATTYLTAWPAGTARPVVSNLNAAAGAIVPNTAIVESPTPFLYNHQGSTHVLADVSGYFLLFDSEPVVPARPAITGVVARLWGSDVRATVSWLPPASTGLPITGYTVTRQPDGRSLSVGADTLSTTFTGLDRHTRYTYTIVATNVIGDSAPARFGPDLPVAPSRVDVNAAGAGEDAYKFLAGTSEDGRYAAMSVKTNSALVPAPYRTATDEGYFLVRKDRVTGETVLAIPAGSTGYVPRLHSPYEVAMSDSGTVVAYGVGTYSSGYVMDLATGTQHFVKDWPGGGAYGEMELSADGQVLVFSDPDQRRFAKYDVRTDTTTTLLQCPYSGGCRVQGVPDLSDDGSTLLLEYAPAPASPLVPTLMDTATGELRALTSATTPDQYAPSYSLSGDGTWVFYVCNACADGRALMRIATTPGATPQRLRATFAESSATAYVGSVSDDGTMVGMMAGADDGWTGAQASLGVVYDDVTGETVPLPYVAEERGLSWPKLSGDGLVATTWQLCQSVDLCGDSRVYAVDLAERTGRATG
jgi:hypothetical protein